jgi:arylsulfatase
MSEPIDARLGACLLACGLLGATGCFHEQAPETELRATAEPVEAPRAADSRPRVVLLVSLDTLRPDRLGFYGYDKFTSPVLDLIAAEGIVFEDASAVSPWTLPSHASMLTGLYPKHHGVRTMETGLPEEVATVAGLLAEAGFQTAAVVNSTWLRKQNYRLTRDFEKYLFIEDIARRRKPNTWVTDQAIEWLDEVRDQNLFVFVHYYDVHSDYASEPFYEKLFTTPYDGVVDGTGWQLTRANLQDEHLELCREDFDASKCTFGHPEGSLVVDSSVEKLQLDSDDLRRLNELYDAGIRQLDAELSRLFAWMRREGVLDESVLIITSDHGEEFMEHGRVDHFLPMWQELLRVPLVFRGPGLRAGARVQAPVSLVDLVPTILSLAGAAPPPETDGLDLSPLLRRASPNEAAEAVERELADRYLYGEAAGGLTYVEWMPEVFPVHRSVRRGSYKLVWESQRETYALYDLAADPAESVDIRAQQPALTEELIAEMQRRFRDEAAEPAAGNRIDLSDEESERLRALGYIQ